MNDKSWMKASEGLYDEIKVVWLIWSAYFAVSRYISCYPKPFFLSLTHSLIHSYKSAFSKQRENAGTKAICCKLFSTTVQPIQFSKCWHHFHSSVHSQPFTTFQSLLHTSKVIWLLEMCVKVSFVVEIGVEVWRAKKVFWEHWLRTFWWVVLYNLP